MSSMLEMSSNFNANMQVTELLMKTLENAAKELASRCIKEVSLKHGFDADEEIRALGLENLSLIRKQMAKKSGPKKEKVVKEKAPKEKKSVFPMPFISEKVDISGCQGLAFNRGLFTQCTKKRMENGNFCKGCQSEADKNASGCPDCGTVESRLATGLYEFKDPKGRSPVSYLKVLEKLKLSSEQALEEAEKQNIEISDEHFQVIEATKKSKGRPSKKPATAVTADNINDLFATLAPEGEDEEVVDTEEKPVKASKKAKLSDEEKALKKAALEAERAQKKAEREAKLAEEKAEKEEKRKAEAEQKKAEREAKLAQEKALAQQQRDAKKAQEKAERDAKKAQEKALKEAEKASKGKKTPEPKPDPVVSTPVAAATPAAKTEGKVTVTRITIGGVVYLKSNTNILYKPDTKEEVGLYDPITKKINPLPEEDDEEVQEEDYESEIEM